MTPARKFSISLTMGLLLGGLFTSLAAAETFEDKLLTTPASPEVLAKGLEADGYALGVSAYTWGYPLVRMERVAREYTDVPSPKPATSYRAPLNQIGWAQPVQGRHRHEGADKGGRRIVHDSGSGRTAVRRSRRQLAARAER